MPLIKHSLLFILFLVFALQACDDAPIPKPRAYFRIDLPEKEYKNYDAPCPFKFDIPQYTGIEVPRGQKDSCSFNLIFPGQNATVYFTYLPVEKDISSYVNDAYQMAYSHELKASAIERSKLEDSDRRVYGTVYDLKGNVATSLQFYATDSLNHFIRGSLYFYSSPNADSIAPVLKFVREDMMHLLNTLEWKE